MAGHKMMKSYGSSLLLPGSSFKSNLQNINLCRYFFKKLSVKENTARHLLGVG